MKRTLLSQIGRYIDASIAKLTLMGRFFINNGKWYRIRSDFLQTVNNSFAEVTGGNLQLPDYSHNDEEAYNISVADGAPDSYSLMDQKFVRYPTTRDQIEFCDLYSRTKTNYSH